MMAETSKINHHIREIAKEKLNNKHLRQIQFDSIDAIASFLKELSESKDKLIPGKLRTLPNQYVNLGSAQDVFFLDVSNHNRILEHELADQVITVETGITLKALDYILRKHDQWLPISGFTTDKTLFEVINSGDGGLLTHGYGGTRNLVLGLHVATTSGDLIRTGGKVVKNVSGYDLTKLFIGSHATLGIPVAAHLRLCARPVHSTSLLLTGDSLYDLFLQSQIFIASGLPASCLELVNLKLWETAISQANCQHILKQIPAFPDKTNGVLFLQLHGHKEVTDEIKSELLAKIDRSITRIIELNDEGGTVLAEQLSYMNEMLNARICLELSLSNRSLRKLFEFLKTTINNSPFQCRPNLGKIRVYEKPEQVDELLSKLTEFTNKEKESFVVAYQDNSYECRYANLPNSDPALDQIKANIKTKFDPAYVLNPIACM